MATEFALVVLPLIIVIFTVIESGYFMRANLAVNSATEEAVRRASVAAKSPTADYAILSALGDDLGSSSRIEQIVVFRAAQIGDGPSVACEGGSSVPGECNVYSNADLDRPLSDFGCITAIDSAWCPTTRSSDMRTPDLVGVQVVYRHDLLTKFFGTSFTLTSEFVLPIERSA